MQNNTLLIALDSFINDHTVLVAGFRVIPDTDLAELFMVDVKALRKKIRANLNSFPDDFMITLSKSDNIMLHGMKYAFTEAGLFMLSGLIHTKRAVEISIGMVELLVDRMPGMAFSLLSKTEE
jgi:hypothetical protein